MMQRFTKPRRHIKTRKASSHVPTSSIVNIFDDVSDFVVDGLKAFPWENEDEYGLDENNRKIS